MRTTISEILRQLTLPEVQEENSSPFFDTDFNTNDIYTLRRSPKHITEFNDRVRELLK